MAKYKPSVHFHSLRHGFATHALNKGIPIHDIRTLMGHASAKDQQLEDHYFGTIPGRANAFMRDFEIEAYKLGIPIKTRHNEVAPNQFECAPVYEEANLAVDHNMLLMDLMKKTSRSPTTMWIFVCA